MNRRELIGGVAGLVCGGTHGKTLGATPADRSDPLGIRSSFPIVEHDVTFLNSAFIAPIPRQVAAAGAAFFERKCRRPLGYDEVLARGEAVRTKYARMINADPDEVAILFSTGEGENIIANGLDLEPGDNVVIDDLNYDTQFVLYKTLEKTRGITLHVVKSHEGAIAVDDYARYVDRKTRLVSVAWVSHRNGFRHDVGALADLAHANGAILHVDAIQGVGAMAMDVKAARIDAMSANSYKWLMAGYGAAPFYARADLVGRLALDRYGTKHAVGTGADGSFVIDGTARRFEYSSRAYGEMWALDASLDFLQQVGVGRIEAHVLGLARQLQEGLRQQGHRLYTPIGNRSPIVSIHTARPVEELANWFSAHKLDVTVRKGLVRISPGAFNVAAEIDRSLEITAPLV